VPQDLTLTNRRELLAKEDADGMALDSEGGLWITEFRSSFLLRVDSAGDEIGRVATSAGAIAQLRFGSADLHDVYFNAVPADGALKDGGEMTSCNSFLFRGRAPVPGLAIAPARFRLH
jgi:sugar lactone lactonase YvrE